MYYILLRYWDKTIGEKQKEVSKGEVNYIQPLALPTILNIADAPIRFVL